jgi:hypothetical protein
LLKSPSAVLSYPNALLNSPLAVSWLPHAVAPRPGELLPPTPPPPSVQVFPAHAGALTAAIAASKANISVMRRGAAFRTEGDGPAPQRVNSEATTNWPNFRFHTSL